MGPDRAGSEEQPYGGGKRTEGWGGLCCVVAPAPSCVKAESATNKLDFSFPFPVLLSNLFSRLGSLSSTESPRAAGLRVKGQTFTRLQLPLVPLLA